MKMVVFDRKVLGTRLEVIRGGKSETTLVISIYCGFKVSREDVAVVNLHIIDKTVGGKLFNESVKWKNILHTGTQRMVFRFGGAKCDFSL